MGPDTAPEEQFGPYLVFERLGVGGMATVHRALERGIEGFERVVALKRLLPHLAADANFIKSFVREAKLASLLNHVNIVQILELGRVATQYFISMEYIDGRDIRRILRHARKVTGPPPIHVIVGLLLQLCEALDYAHHKVDDAGHPLGLVHRDVSPSNVLVTSAGQVKVIDFGIAKAQSAQLRTQTGRVKGKLAYMAPEALAGKDLDARSDLFAAGVIAHELVTARPLFASKNEYQTLMKVQRGEVMPPSTFNQHCPPELDAIVLRALARDPDDRFLHAGELRDELHAMRKQYNLQTSDRDVARWLEWAFGAEHGAPAAPPARPSRGPKRHDDDDAVELAWGGHDEHGSGGPVVLDDVPDFSDKHVSHPSALGAEVRLDLDDLADDIPTPLPSHGRPAASPSSRTVTTPLRPRHAVRKKPVIDGVRSSAAMAAQPDAAGMAGAPSVSDRPTVPLGPAPPVSLGTPAPALALAPADDDRATDSNAVLAASLRGALVPSRVRTITMPPRAMPSASVAPTSVAAAALPPRIVPTTSEPSRGVPVPAPASRSAAIAAAPSRGITVPTPASRSVPVPVPASHSVPVSAPASRSVPAPASRSVPVPVPAAEPSRGNAAAVEISRGIPVAIEPSYTGPAPTERSRPGRSPRAVPAVPSSPRPRRATAPGNGAPPLDKATIPLPMFAERDTRVDLMPTERTPAFPLDDLGLASDTMPSMPALPATESVVRFHESTVPDAPPSDATPPSDVTPPVREPPAPEETRTGTARTRLITPATALFAEPDELSTTHALATVNGAPRAPHRTIADGPPVHRRITLGRVLIVVLALVLISAATTAAALYLTRDAEVPVESRPVVPPAPSKLTGTLQFSVVPADATITIVGVPMHAGSPWEVELDPGVHQIEIVRAGYKGWLSAVKLAPGQVQALQVTLEPLGSAVAAEATLVLGSTPGGLDILVDGVSRGRTPSKLVVPAGRHAVALRAGGAEVWAEDIDARASAVYEYRPTITEPARRPADGASAAPAPPPPGAAAAPAMAPADPASDPTATPAGPVTPPAPVATPAAAPPEAILPTVSATDVTRSAGQAPRIIPPADTPLPDEITAKLCIDEAGHVTSASVTSPLEAGVAAQIVQTLRTWEYKPYEAGGTARAVCFPVTFRPR